MTHRLTSRTALLVALILTAVGGIILLSSAASAGGPPKPKISGNGVGDVKLGNSYRKLRQHGQISKIGPGCKFGGPRTRAALLKAPLHGGVNFSLHKPRVVENILIRGGAKARGLGIGAKIPKIRNRFPGAKVRHSTDEVFGVTLVKIPKSDGGRFTFGVSVDTKKTVMIGVPYIPFCE